jgi:chitinase
MIAMLALLLTAPTPARSQPIDMAAPYEYLGWGDPQPPTEVMADSGIRDITLAFVLSKGDCNPEWEGRRALLGGKEQAAIEAIRAAGGEVVVSFGGWSGRKLGSACASASALAGAYEKVIEAYQLQAIDIDIEHTEFTSAKVRERVVEALALVARADPGLEISITMGTTESGPEHDGTSLIADAVKAQLMPTAWTIMPFDFGPPRTDMGHASIRAVEGLAHDLASAYGISMSAAYAHAGISSMNGDTDEKSETVTGEDFETMLAFARANSLARMTFWSVNRDRPCESHDAPEEQCSGIAQTPLQFTDLLAGY